MQPKGINFKRLTVHDYSFSSCKLLHQEYPCVPETELPKLLREHDFCLRSTYLTLDTFVHTWHSLPEKPWVMTSDPSTIKKPYSNIQNQRTMRATIKTARDSFKKAVLEELAVCWKIRATRDKKRRLQEDAGPSDKTQEHVEKAIDGDLVECQCCFLECPLHEMVHCEGETIHVRSLALNPLPSPLPPIL